MKGLTLELKPNTSNRLKAFPKQSVKFKTEVKIKG